MHKIVVLGASSPVGQQVLRLLQARADVLAISRQERFSEAGAAVRWVLAEDFLHKEQDAVDYFISVAPIWKLKEYFPKLQQLGCKKVVCVSSTSRFTKVDSTSSYEGQIVANLVEGEVSVKDWAESHSVEWVILRPTLIYGHSTDKNLYEIAKMIGRFGCFPLFGRADGKRQPIYVDDVAQACVSALFSKNAHNKAYNISGLEVLTYREMVKRVFEAMGKKPRFVTINLKVFDMLLSLLRLIPRYKHWNTDMVQRMNMDMVFNHDEAVADFGFSPQKFQLTGDDVKVV